MSPLVNGPGPGFQAQAKKRFAVGKLIALASPESGMGRSVCAASVAISLAQRWRCLVVDLDTRTRNLQNYFGLQAANVAISEFLENSANSLETIQTRTRVTNLDCIGWSAAGAKPVALGSLRIDSLLRSMHSHPADYVLATLPAGATGDTLELFTAADIPVLVTHSTPALLERVLEFLRSCASTGFDGRTVYLVVNRVQRGGEVREASALVEKAKESLGLNVSILGTIQYDHQLEASFRPGSPLSVQRSQNVTALAFEDIALKIERLLPRGRLDTAGGLWPRKTRRNTNGNLRDAVMTSFGGKSKQLQEELRQRDESLRRFQQQHQRAIEDLQQIIGNKNEEIAGDSALIRELEEKVQLYTSDLSERKKYLSELEDSNAAIVAQNEVIQRERETIAQQREETARSLVEAETLLQHKNQEIQNIAERLERVTAFSEELKTTLGGKNAQLINHAEDLERTVAVQRNEIEQLRDQIGQLQSFNAAIEQKNAGLFSETQDLGFQRDETARRLDEAEAHAHDQKVLLEQKDQTIHDLGDRLAQLASEQERSAAEATQVIRHLAEEVRLQRDETLRRLADVEKSVREQLAADHAVVASQSAETSQQLSREIQSQREEIVRGLAEVETRIRDRDAVLKRKDQEIQKLAERLADLASEQGISANRAAETLQQLSGEIQLHRHQTMRGLVEAESRLKDRDVALEQRDLLIHALEECVARLTSEQSAIINRTTEALQRFSEEIQFQREESTAEIERYRSLASGSEERTQALLAQVAQVNDAARQKEMGVRQMESTLRQEISELQELRHRNEAAIGGLEKRVRLLEQENHQLKFD